MPSCTDGFRATGRGHQGPQTSPSAAVEAQSGPVVGSGRPKKLSGLQPPPPWWETWASERAVLALACWPREGQGCAWPS